MMEMDRRRRSNPSQDLEDGDANSPEFQASPGLTPAEFGQLPDVADLIRRISQGGSPAIPELTVGHDSSDRARLPDWAPDEIDDQGNRTEIGKTMDAHTSRLVHTRKAPEWLEANGWGVVLPDAAEKQLLTDSCVMAASSAALTRLEIPDGQRALIALSLESKTGYRGHLWGSAYPERLSEPPERTEGTWPSDAEALLNRVFDLGAEPATARLDNPAPGPRENLDHYQVLCEPGVREVLIEYPPGHMVHIESVSDDSMIINESETGRRVKVSADMFRYERSRTTHEDVVIQRNDRRR